eukprot:scaffold3342_cov174-Amphora_coffeaeformis.AAC.9
MLDHQMIGDAVRLVQILRNLISNAIKFSREGGFVKVNAKYMPVTSRSSAKERAFQLLHGEQLSVAPHGSVVVTVQDNGVGMSSEELSKLFNEGTQFNVRVIQGGQGSWFGLSFAKALVELHDGTFRADSPGLGQGSNFTMTLPLYHIPLRAAKVREKLLFLQILWTILRSSSY